MKLTNHQELWNRIQQFTIDDPTASIKYSDKLAFQNSWTPAFTRRVIEEYRRFIFLCCISPTGASPSEIVDEAWHLHLTYTQNYWVKFCRDTLDQQVHHHPSKGGLEEKQRHVEWYLATLEYYKEVFEEEPPADIWPLQENRGMAQSPDEVIQKAGIKVGVILPLLLPFIVPFIYEELHPFSLTGPQFMFFYIALIVCSFISLYMVYRDRKRLVTKILTENYQGDANVYQFSRYVFGSRRSLHSAIVDLVERKIFVPRGKNQFTFHPENYTYSPAEDNPLIQGLLRTYESGKTVSYAGLEYQYDYNSTSHPGLATAYKGVAAKTSIEFWIAGIVLLIGVSRLIQGAERNNPIAFLVGTILATAFIFLGVCFATKMKYVLTGLVRSKYKNGRPGFAFEQKTMAVNQYAMLGLVVLAVSSDTDYLKSVFSSGYRGGGDAGGGTGCGSSCGGDCGSGGCGGCGGD